MNEIVLLSQDTIDKIAAGEVVERPASVVKELVENAVDAGANAVTVEIRDGGTSLVRITDNGCGIPKEQVRIAYMQHATSKIRKVEDLLTSDTLGFRGEALSSIAAVSRVEMVKCQDLFRKFGGHPMAAGFSLPRSRIDEMRRRLNENCTMTEEDMAEKIMVDVPMPINYIRESLVEELSVLEPFGNGNEKPLFAERHLKLLSARILGKNANVLKLQVANATGCTMEALYFGIPDNILSYLADKYGRNEVQKLLWGKVNQIEMDLTYYPSINEYQGRRTLQIVIKNFR